MASNRPCSRDLIVALPLSALFTVTLFYLTFEVPAVLDRVLVSYFPEAFLNVEVVERILSTLRPAGYVTLTVTTSLIVLGFIVRKASLAFLGSIALYIPTFSYFTSAMFFLTGLGALRSLWLPLLELSPTVLKLGCIVYLPFTTVPYAPLVGVAVVFVGLLIFTFGTVTWLYGRFRGYGLVDFWIYGYSRHPQYLGFILWSYGLLIYVSYKPYVRGAFTTPPALIWLLTVMVVIGIALVEEVEMIRKYGEVYGEYRRRTSFMIPLPKPLARVITLPTRVVGGYPKSVEDVVIIITLYTTILTTLSYILMLILEV